MTAAEALRRYGATEPARSVAHDVWLSESHAVKVSDGRLRETLRHERDVLQAVPDSVPHPDVLEYGADGRAEWLVLSRLSGVRLTDAWRELDRVGRRRIATEMGAALRAIHGTPRPERFAPPWLDDALAPGGVRGDAYHAPPAQYPLLVDAARALSQADQQLLDEVEHYLSTAARTFVDDHMVLAHTDYAPTNLLAYKGNLSAVLDFEGARPAARDAELTALIRFSRAPEEYGVDPGEDWSSLVPTVLEEYAELAVHPRLGERLTTYALLWGLVQAHHWPDRAFRVMRELLDKPCHWPEVGAS